MVILLTGATGFVGFNLLLHFLTQPSQADRIIACVRHGGKLLTLLSEAKIPGIPSQIHVHECTASDWKLHQLPAEPDICIHCAGALFCPKPEDYFTTNVAGTLRLLHALPAKTSAILLSSQSAVGPTPPGSPPVNEDSPAQPISFYGKSKLQMEQAAVEFAEKHGRSVVLLRPPTVIGPWDVATLPLFKITDLPVWFKPGSQVKWLSWIAVSDLVSAICKVIKSLPCSGTFFVQSKPEITDEQLLLEAGRVMNRSAPVIKVPDWLLRRVVRLAKAIPALGKAIPSLTADRAAELLHPNWLVDDSRFRKQFDWQPSATLCETLRQTLENYRLRSLL